VTNRRDVVFTVAWRTDRPSTGWIEYGAGARLDRTASDDRGPRTVARLHHVTVTGLIPETTYTFRVHSGDSVVSPAGAPYRVTTAATGALVLPLTAYGQAQDAAGSPAAGALIRAWLVGANGSRSEPLSTLVDGWGYWNLSLLAEGCAERQLILSAVGADGAAATLMQPACDVQPAPTLTLQPQTWTPTYLPLVVR
jgi:hypothetical protein